MGKKQTLPCFVMPVGETLSCNRGLHRDPQLCRPWVPGLMVLLFLQ